MCVTITVNIPIQESKIYKINNGHIITILELFQKYCMFYVCLVTQVND